ncbi:carbohydrate ABC transporter permease [Blautia schinkii]|nr:carbohydrate ABC transporter permease [Blautia schinkii]
MNTKTKTRLKMPYIILCIIIIACLAVYIFPLIFSVVTSLKSSEEFYESIWALPKEFLYSNYIEAFQIGKIGAYMINSIIISAVSLVSIQVFALLAAYALSRLKIPHVEAFLLVLLLLQVLPTESVIIPLYIIVSKLHLLSVPYLATILGYVGWSLPGTIIILKNYFDTVPIDLLEAARIDGSSEFQTMTKIILPLMKAPMVTCLIMNFTYVWGELMWAQVTTLLTDKGVTITVGLLNFQGQYGTNWPLLTAAIVTVIVPLLIIFVALQKYFVAGLTAGGVKG